MFSDFLVTSGRVLVLRRKVIKSNGGGKRKHEHLKEGEGQGERERKRECVRLP